MKSIESLDDINQKKILLRLDLNVPIKNGYITDTSRIEKVVPTINLLIQKEAKIIIISHIGRPKGKVVAGMSLKPISEKLSFLLKKEVLFNKETITQNTISEINKISNVIHLAAESHVDKSIKKPDDFIKTNVLGVSNLLNWSLEYYNKIKNSGFDNNNFKFIHISTDEVYGSLNIEDK